MACWSNLFSLLLLSPLVSSAAYSPCCSPALGDSCSHRSLLCCCTRRAEAGRLCSGSTACLLLYLPLSQHTDGAYRYKKVVSHMPSVMRMSPALYCTGCESLVSCCGGTVASPCREASIVIPPVESRRFCPYECPCVHILLHLLMCEPTSRLKGEEF